MPIVITYLGTHIHSLSTIDSDLQKLVSKFTKQFPKGHIKKQFTSLDKINLKLTFLYINFMIIPFFLMSAIINSAVISSYSFAGEKERKTLETLLFSPITIKELFVSKMIAAFVPSIVMTYIAFFLCAIFVNLIVYPSFKILSFFTPTWMTFMFWLVPILIIFNILLNIFVSAKVKTFQEAQQFGGIMVLPVIGLIVSQSTGLFFLSPFLLLIIGLVLFLLNLLLLKIMTKFNQRNTLFESQIH
jgi:ABC-type Na+ efflux pump permease subunit